MYLFVLRTNEQMCLSFFARATNTGNITIVTVENTGNSPVVTSFDTATNNGISPTTNSTIAFGTNGAPTATGTNATAIVANAADEADATSLLLF